MYGARFKHKEIEEKCLMKSPDPLPAELIELLEKCGQLLANADWRPQPSPDTLRRWDENIEAWIRNTELPLFVRRSSLPRGTIIVHETGRKLVPTDNSPAHWVFARAVEGVAPTLDEQILSEVPIAMAMKKTEKETATYLTSGRKGLLNDWKLCHIEPVKVGRGELSAMPIDRLEDQLRRFLKSSNMFVIPKELGGLGEIEIVIQAIRGIAL